jgi:hypothetical protein
VGELVRDGVEEAVAAAICVASGVTLVASLVTLKTRGVQVGVGELVGSDVLARAAVAVGRVVLVG